MARYHGKDEAVEAIIAQAMDQVALENIAAINTSHFSDANVLPTALESRFRTLKSLPKSNPVLDSQAQEQNIPQNQVPNFPIPSEDSKPTSPVDLSPHVVRPVESPRPTVVAKSREQTELLSSPDSSPGGKKKKKQQSVCCFGFSPKKWKTTGKKGSKGIGELGMKKMEGEDEEEFHDDVGTLSILKEQKRKIKKALKEQEKVHRETEKLVELVKQASMKLDFSASIDELLSDDDDDDKFF